MQPGLVVPSHPLRRLRHHLNQPRPHLPVDELGLVDRVQCLSHGVVVRVPARPHRRHDLGFRQGLAVANCAAPTVWWTSPDSATRAWYFAAIAIVSASLARVSHIWCVSCYPTISRWNTSRMNVVYTHPACVGTYVMSATHKQFGAGAAN